MKKIFYSIIAFSLILTSCGETATEETAEETNTENATTDSVATESPVDEVALPEGWEKTQNETLTYLAIKDSVTGNEWANFSEKLGNNYGQLVGYMMENGIEQAGMPLTQWLTFDEEGTSVYTAGIPVAEGTEAGEGVEVITIPAGAAYKYVHMGAYAETEAAHMAINDYMYSSGNLPTGGPWEIYVTDPGMEPDTSKWVTEIWYPIAE